MGLREESAAVFELTIAMVAITARQNGQVLEELADDSVEESGGPYRMMASHNRILAMAADELGRKVGQDVLLVELQGRFNRQ